MSDPAPGTAPFGSSQFPVAVLYTVDADGGWHVDSVYYRVNGGPVQQHPHWPEGFGGTLPGNPQAAWNYLSERYLEDNGGNGITWDIGAFEVETEGDIEPAMVAVEAELVAAPYGLLIEGGTIADKSDGVLNVMPAVIGYDDGPVLTWTPTPDTATGLEVTEASTSSRVEPMSTSSLLNPQVKWALKPGSTYLVRAGDQAWTLVATESGEIASLTPGTSPPDVSTVDEIAASSGAAEGTLHLDRQPPPAWVSNHEEQAWAADCLGGQKEWCWAIPWVFRVLASPYSYERMPAWPRPRHPSDHIPGAGYWNALLYLLCYSFGWSRPDRGLEWWVQRGKPVDDLRLRLLAEVWDGDGHLDWFRAFLLDFGWQQASESPLGRFCKHYDGSPMRIDREWVRERIREGEGNSFVHPGGLHLSVHHLDAVEDAPEGGCIRVQNAHQRTAIFTTNSMNGWYSALIKAWDHLPGGSTDWRVDVVVRPVGWLGSYRRSWETGLVFAGKHRFHEVGN